MVFVYKRKTFHKIKYWNKNVQSIKYNWNNKIIMLQDGILYTSSRLAGTSVEDSDVFLATFLHVTITLILDQHAISTSELPTSSC